MHTTVRPKRNFPLKKMSSSTFTITATRIGFLSVIPTATLALFLPIIWNKALTWLPWLHPHQLQLQLLLPRQLLPLLCNNPPMFHHLLLLPLFLINQSRYRICLRKSKLLLLIRDLQNPIDKAPTKIITRKRRKRHPLCQVGQLGAIILLPLLQNLLIRRSSTPGLYRKSMAEKNTKLPYPLPMVQLCFLLVNRPMPLSSGLLVT